MLLVIAAAAFCFGAFWSAIFTYAAMSENGFAWYWSALLAGMAGLIGGTACGALVGIGLAYIMLPK